MQYKFKALALFPATTLEALQLLLTLCVVLTGYDVGFTFFVSLSFILFLMFQS